MLRGKGTIDMPGN